MTPIVSSSVLLNALASQIKRNIINHSNFYFIEKFSVSFGAIIFTMNQVVYFHLVYLLKFLTVVMSGDTGSCIIEQSGRQERALLFPPSSTIGVRTMNFIYFVIK